MTKDQAIVHYSDIKSDGGLDPRNSFDKPTPDCRNVTPAEDVLLRNATLRAGKKIEKPDCRTCEHKEGPYCGQRIHHNNYCTNGDQYQPAPSVVLWRTE